MSFTSVPDSVAVATLSRMVTVIQSNIIILAYRKQSKAKKGGFMVMNNRKSTKR